MATNTVTKEQAMAALFSDRRLTLETLLEIENKQRQLVPFKLNPIQADMIATSGWRDIYVKPASVGATSLWGGDFLIDNVTINGTVSVIVSYDEFSAKRLLLKAKKFHQSLLRRIPTIPLLDHKAAEQLSFTDKDTNFNSDFYIFSARSYVIGRGEAIHNLLLDEYAFWPVGTHESVWASAINRVPAIPGTKVRILSTANGEDNPFCEMYRAAKEGINLGSGRAQSVFKPHFYPWIIHPEYTMSKDDEFCLNGDDVHPLPNLQDDELSLLRLMVTVFNFTDIESMDKLRWRRFKKLEMASMSRTGEYILLFSQEFPEDDESCFLTSGNDAYNTDIINEKIRNCYPPSIHRNLVNPKNGTSADMEVWYDVEEGEKYLLSIDPGKGKTSESVGHVWVFKEGYVKGDIEVPPVFRHCATIAGYYDEWEMAIFCMEGAKYYNGAVIAPEDNLDIVSHLREWPSLYYREDPRDGRSRRAIGWQTNVATKPYMITEVNRNLEYIECHDQRFWSQCKNIKRDASIRSGITVVGADDHHDCGAIAIVCRTAVPVEIGYIGSAGWSDSWGQ